MACLVVCEVGVRVVAVTKQLGEENPKRPHVLKQ